MTWRVTTQMLVPTRKVTAVMVVTADTSVTSAPLSRQSQWSRWTRRRRIWLGGASQMSERCQDYFGIDSGTSNQGQWCMTQILSMKPMLTEMDTWNSLVGYK